MRIDTNDKVQLDLRASLTDLQPRLGDTIRCRSGDETAAARL